MVDLLGSGLAFVVALGMTGMIRSHALRRSLLDVPNHRSSHASPTPKCGGLAITLPFLLGLFAYFHWHRLDASALWPLSVGGVMIATVGLVDDWRHVGPGWRILVHFSAVSFGLYWLGGIPATAVAGVPFLSGPAGNMLALLALVWLINLFNFMDGIDGLAATEAVYVALGAAFILSWHAGPGRQEVRMLLLFAGPCMGFLVWNWPPAKIFMGDVGSGFLGYVIGILAVLSLQSRGMTLPAWLILLTFFLVDATVTLLARVIQGERWYEAHCSHAYQGAARRYRSHKKVTMAVLITNVLWLFPLAFLAAARPQGGWLLLLVAWAPVVVLVLRERSLAKNNAA